MKSVALVVVVWGAVVASGCSHTVSTSGVPKIKEGDCWSYDARPWEETSFIVIRKIERTPKYGEIIHVSLYNIEDPLKPGYPLQLGLFTIAGANLRASLKVKLEPIKWAQEMPWESDYKRWRRTYESKGDAFVNTKSVKDLVEFIDESIRKKGLTSR